MATRPQRARLAFFSPLPPMRSGIADYARELLDELAHHFAIDVFYDRGARPAMAAAAPHIGFYDYRLFDGIAREVPYRAVLYQMGNNVSYHSHIYRVMQRHLGVVTLHDFGIVHFQWSLAEYDALPADHFWREVQDNALDADRDFVQQLPRGPEAIDRLLDRGLFLNRRVFEASHAVVVHDRWGVQKLRERFPQYVSKTHVIPFGIHVPEVTVERAAAIRASMNVAPDALVFACFGLIQPSKMNTEALHGFAQVAREHSESLFIMAGHEYGAGQTARLVRELGLEGRVRILGHVSQADFWNVAAITDVGINLRRGPTNGETSASLIMLLANGVPTVVTNVGTFASYPDDVVAKIPWDQTTQDALTATMRRLANDAQERQRIGAAALRHARQVHSWDRVAQEYIRVIESTPPRPAPAVDPDGRPPLRALEADR